MNWEKLAVVNAHPRDAFIQFEEDGHKYTINSERLGLPPSELSPDPIERCSLGWLSCTSFVHSFFDAFDADAVIDKMQASSKWSESKYFGMTKEAIKEMWATKAKESSEAGTALHLDIEHFYNDDADWIPASKDTVEWQFFLSFHNDYIVPRGYQAYRTEWLVFDEASKIPGSIDMVYKKPDGTFAIFDWKRTGELKKENRFQSGTGPLSHLPDVNYWHYSLQLNVYRYILQKYYGVVVTELALVILHPNNTNYRVVKLNFMDDEVAAMMATRMDSEQEVPAVAV